MKLKQIRRICHDLVAIRPGETRPLELDYEHQSFAEQYAVDSEAASSKVKLKDDIVNRLTVGLLQRMLESRYALSQAALQSAHAVVPFLRLRFLDLQAFQRCASCELVGDMPSGFGQKL
ncbi:MAG: hypothetical protein WA208_08370 [Thermoanaerobaculia bacterium]